MPILYTSLENPAPIEQVKTQTYQFKVKEMKENHA